MKEVLLRLFNVSVSIICIFIILTLISSLIILLAKFLFWLSVNNINFGGIKI